VTSSATNVLFDATKKRKFFSFITEMEACPEGLLVLFFYFSHR
jgi:hypothetical protein